MTTTAPDAPARPLAPAARGGSPAGSRLSRPVRQHPLLTFFVLSCLFSWWPAGLGFLGWSNGGLAGFGPFLAAVVVLGLTQGRSGVRDLLVRMVRWRVPARNYLVAVAVPVAIVATSVGLTVLVGGTRPSAEALAAWTQIPVMLLLMLLIPGMGGAWEEPGFRGYALGRLEERFGLSAAPLVLGLSWNVWHLPLFLAGAIKWTDTVVILAVSVVLAAIYHASRKSILIVMLLHATNNAIGGEFASQLFTGADATRMGAFMAAIWVLVALAVILVQRRRRGSRTR